MSSSQECSTSRRPWEHLKRANIAPRPARTRLTEYAIQPKKTRARKPKVRSGCISCKIRRVKCDEGKPTCQRCKCLSQLEASLCRCLTTNPCLCHETTNIEPIGQKASLKCDGYGSKPLHTSPNPIKIATSVVPGRPLGRPLLPRRNPWPAVFDRQDVIYFDLFQTQLVYDLSGYSCSDFWSRIVLCESMIDKCVLELALAIGALSTAVTLASQLRDQPSLSKCPSALHPWTAEVMANDHHKAAVCHYVKALTLFRSRVKAGTAMLSPRSVLIISVLFITFEMLQGDMKTVDGLITSSINLLKGTLKLYRQDARSNHNAQSTPRAEEDDMEDIEHLLPLISIMSGYTPFLISQSANIQLWDTSRGHDLPDVGQSSIAKLQTQWSKFYTRTAAFIGRALAIQMQATTPPLAAEERQRVLIAQLNVWEAELDSWLAKSKAYGEPAQRTLQVMQIQHLKLLICVSSCLDATELAFDAREADFHTLLMRCAIFLHEARPTYYSRSTRPSSARWVW
jgi:hypothetical protein